MNLAMAEKQGVSLETAGWHDTNDMRKGYRAEDIHVSAGAIGEAGS
jgi:hypothetical protein